MSPKFAKKGGWFTPIIATSALESNKKVEESPVDIVEYRKGSILMGPKKSLND